MREFAHWIAPQAIVNIPVQVKNAKPQFLVAMIVPAIAIGSYYLCLCRYSYNFPYFDDFEVILGFLNRFITGRQFSEKLPLLFEQHGEHRLFFDRAVALAAYLVLGKIDFRSLVLIGNTALLGILVLCYKVADKRREIAAARPGAGRPDFI
jgi:hypothetical protein